MRRLQGSRLGGKTTATDVLKPPQATLTRRLACVVAIGAVTGLWTRAAAQDGQENGGDGGDYQFVSGVVASLGSDRIVVRRTGSGRAPEQFTFLIVSETRVEGKLRVQARVTVGYKRGPDGDVAVRVIVRPEDAPPGAKP